MEFGTREILIVLGVLVLLAILLDGVRRVNQARSGKLRTAKRKQPIFDDDDWDDYTSELPSGGARVVEVRNEDKAAEISQKLREESDFSRNKYTSPYRDKTAQKTTLAPEPTDSDDSIGQEKIVAAEPVSDRPRETVASPVDQASAEPQLDPEPVPEAPQPKKSLPNKPTVNTGPSKSQPARPTRSENASSQPAPGDVLIFHLMAKKGEQFKGPELLEQMLAHGLRYGDMKIFHRHEAEDGSGAILFSVANSLNPGTFDLAAIDDFSSPGITFLMPLDQLRQPLESFDMLVKIATAMAKKLNGELKDETRSALTRQTTEHYKQRIIEFTRRSFTLTH